MGKWGNPEQMTFYRVPPHLIRRKQYAVTTKRGHAPYMRSSTQLTHEPSADTDQVQLGNYRNHTF